MIKKVFHNHKLLALVVPKDYSEPGIHFFTPHEFSQQLAYIRHPSGKILDSHVHNPVLREVQLTQEVLFIRRGRLRVDLYDDQRNYLESIVLNEGDVILLASGGHGFEILEEVEMIEVKQGPYTGDWDKTRFDGIECNQVRIKE
jgi:mannose-6-phosphate isomerase-like protein (cupin superfamily)